jgi:hypothetical protein
MGKQGSTGWGKRTVKVIVCSTVDGSNMETSPDGDTFLFPSNKGSLSIRKVERDPSLTILSKVGGGSPAETIVSNPQWAYLD